MGTFRLVLETSAVAAAIISLPLAVMFIGDRTGWFDWTQKMLDMRLPGEVKK